jgi:hypothetical protein
MKVVSGTEADKTPFGSQELVIDIHKEHMLSIVHLRNYLVAFFDLPAIRIIRTGTAREDSNQQNFGVREILAEFENNRTYAFGYHWSGGTAIHVVGAKHERDGFWLVTLSFTILETPEDALSGVA